MLKKFAPELGELIAKRVREGSLFLSCPIQNPSVFAVKFRVLEEPECNVCVPPSLPWGPRFYMGRSAGAMTASRDFGLTYEPNPALTTVPRVCQRGFRFSFVFRF